MIRSLLRPTLGGLMTLLAATATLSASASAAPAGDFDSAVQPFLQQHCLRCHDAKVQKGEFRIDTLAKDLGGSSTQHWAEIMGRISSGEMPPKKEPQPDAKDASRVVEWLAAKLKEGEAARLARREPVSFHKLTRDEYANTIHDLLGVQFDPADPTGLPEDGEWHGFERIGSVLSVSPSHIEKYFAAAEGILNEAMPSAPVKKFYRKKEALELRGSKEKWAHVADRVRVEMWPGHDLGGRASPGGALPVAGDYRVRIQLSGLKPPGGRAPHLAVYARDLDRMLFERDIIAPEDKPIIVEFTTHLPAGNVNVSLSNEVPGPSNLPRSGRSGDQPFFSIKEGRLPWQMKLTDEQGVPLYPFLILDWMEWEGPITPEGPTWAQKQYLPANPSDRAEVRAKLTTFTERAFRRPVQAVEIDRLLALLDSEIKSGEKFEAAYKTTLLAVLCSKDFLYVVEGKLPDPADNTAAAGQSGRLAPFELASRLSYFLWETMPDEALFAAARDGSLGRPDVLQSQVRRMLADPKAQRFVDSFTRQWLQLRKVGMFPPDKKLYPDYDAWLEKSMVGETTAYFGQVLRQNLSIAQFLESDWTMVNARLAEHYQIEGLDDSVFQASGDGFVKVALKPEHRRGGILTHASVLSLTSDGTRHRPVHRGAWVLESIFNRTPPPPPANVKPIEPTPTTAPKATVRMKLAAHVSDANCAACHAKIDPLGFAFDNYDAIGRWRTEEVVSDGQGQNPTVDASGELADGRKFTDAPSFKRLLLSDLDAFNVAFTEKLATFAMRRAMTIDDRGGLDEVAARGKAADYRLQAIVEALILSDLFQKR